LFGYTFHVLTEPLDERGRRSESIAWAVVGAAAGAVGTAAWLIPASVRIVGWSGGLPQRIALVAPLSRLWISLALSSLVAAVVAARAQRSGRLARTARSCVPLLLFLLWAAPFLPWPSRAPLLLLFSGPLRWAVAALAIGGCAASWVDWRNATLPALSARTVFLVSLAVYSALGLQFVNRPGLGGDEPHYLVITHSLLVDHDLDIANNHERRDYRTFFGGTLRPDYLRRGQRGEIYSVHAPGLPALLLPAYAADGARGAVVFVALLAAATAVAVFEIATAVGGAAIGALVWAAICLTVPFAPHAWLLYPELPAALIVAWSMLWMWRRSESTAALVVHGAFLAALPWLHTKFVVLTGALSAIQALRLWPRVSRIVGFAAPIVLGTALWLASFYWMYGTFDPQAPYGAFAAVNVATANVPHGTLGLLFDKKFGLLIYSPVYALAVVGLIAMLRERRTRGLAGAIALAAAAFLVSTTRFYMWWGGSSAPARFLVPVVPLAAPAIAAAIARARGTVWRSAVAVLLTASVAIAGVCVLSPGANYLFSDPHGPSALVSAVQGGAPLDDWLPTFTEEQWHASAVQLAYWLAACALAGLATAAAVRWLRARSAPVAVTIGTFTLVTAAAALPGSRSGYERDAIALRGRLELMREYDASRLRAVDVTRVRKLAVPALLAALAIDVPRREMGGSGGRAASEYSDLPAGEFEARVWFNGGEAARTVRVEMPHEVVLARTDALAHPIVLPFTMAVAAPVRIVADGGIIARWEIVPIRLLAGNARSTIEARAIDPADGPPGSYIAYVDDRSYPEGGVYWTRGTDTSRTLLVPGGGREALLVLHVGPNAGRVALRVGTRQQDIDMAAEETRQIAFPLPEPIGPVEIAVRAARAFRPSAADPSSDDQRSLGCQVRPLIR
jgi:hypothetical protein